MRRIARGLPLLLTLAVPLARAGLPDEVQIHTDDINEPGEWGLELHVDTTPRGLKDPAYPGEVVADRGLRIMPDHRSRDWLVGVNPVSSWALSFSQIQPAPRNPQFSFNTKLTRRVGDQVSVRLAYYNDEGRRVAFEPAGQLGKTLYAVVDVENRVMPFHVGIGRGLTVATDRWTVKLILDVPP